jgi:hypothetical protein
MKGRLFAGLLVVALGLSGCVGDEATEVIVTSDTTTTAAFETSTAVETTTAVTTKVITTTTTTIAPETTTIYIRDTSNDLPFSGEINADQLEYIKMLNISSGYGYMAFDDEFLYYTDFEDDAGDHYVYDPDKIYKAPISGGEPIVIFDKTDEFYYQKIRNIFVSNDRIYFHAIETPHDFSGGGDSFVATLYSINTDGGDVRIEVEADFAQVYIIDNKAYFYRDYLGSIEPGFIEIDKQTDEYQQILDSFGLYSFCTDDIILFYGLESKNIALYDRTTGKELFRMNDMDGFFPTALYGDYLYSGTGEFINIKTFEIDTYFENGDNEIINGMNIYQNKLYFYVLTMDNNRYTAKKLVSYDFSNGESDEIELFSSETPIEYEWWENYIYSTPAGLFSYDENGRIFRVVK